MPGFLVASQRADAVDILHLLRKRGAALSYCDPYVPEIRDGVIDLKASPNSSPRRSKPA